MLRVSYNIVVKTSIMTIKKLIADFVNDLENNRRRSARTARNYDFYLKRFSDWLNESGVEVPGKITEQAIQDYSVWLKNVFSGTKKTKLKNNTRNYHLIAVRAFLKYLVRKKINSLAPKQVRLAVLTKSAPKFLEKIELEKLLEAPFKKNQEKILQLRDRAILELILCSGMKVSEIAGLNKDVMNLNKAAFAFKGKIKRTISLSNQVRYWLKKYFELRHDKNKFLFVSHDRASLAREKTGLTPRSIERLVERYGQMTVASKKVTPQILRHSYAINLARSGETIEIMKEKLGHRSLNSASCYFDNK